MLSCRPTHGVAEKELAVRDIHVRVPSDWNAVADSDDAYLLSPPGDSSTSLRVSALTVISAESTRGRSAIAWLHAATKLDTASVERIGPSSALLTYDTTFTEFGKLVRMRFWWVAHKVDADTVRIGIISLAQAIQGPGDSLRPTYVSIAEHLVRTARY